MELPWIEKHRPSSISEIYNQTEASSLLKNCIDTKDVPHLLFCGDNGTGKTSAALAFCRELYKENYSKDKVLLLNSNDDRGIQSIRERIKMFAMNAINDDIEPRLKIVILDEVDCMTIDAQSALRRIMETTSHTTRFCLICNRINSVIDPIISRCTMVLFKKHTRDSLKNKIADIIAIEKIDIDDDVIDAIIAKSGGDMRKCIMGLQLAKIYGYEDNGVNITQLLYYIGKNNKIKVRECVEKIVSDGYSAKEVINAIYQNVLTIKKKEVVKIIMKIGEYQSNLLQGSNEYLAILGLSFHLCDYLAKAKNKAN